jgi:hypothetical protein
MEYGTLMGLPAFSRPSSNHSWILGQSATKSSKKIFCYEIRTEPDRNSDLNEPQIGPTHRRKLLATKEQTLVPNQMSAFTKLVPVESSGAAEKARLQ